MDRRDFIRHSLFGAGGIMLAGTGLIACTGNSKEAIKIDEKTGMTLRRLGKTGLMVSEIGLGAEWLERCGEQECRQVVNLCEERGVNIVDIWMSNPEVRTNLGKALEGSREKWFIQGHIGSTWQNGQYERTRDLEKVEPAFEDLLTRLNTKYVDLGMIHCVDALSEWDEIASGEFYKYVKDLKKKGKIRHIGLGTHSVKVAQKAAESGLVEMIMFSLNPAYDMLPSGVDIWGDDFSQASNGINPDRAKLYQTCEANDVGITVMKGYAGGRLFDAQLSPFGVALTPIQCLHYALTRPAVSSVMVGCKNMDEVLAAVAYETAGMKEKDYASVLANAPAHPYGGQCTYCGHCKPCNAGIDIAMVNKLTDLAEMHKDNIPSSVLDHYKLLKKHASDCVECGGCEMRCPFRVKVISKMRKAKELFGY